MTPNKIASYFVGGYFLIGFFHAIFADIKAVHLTKTKPDPEIVEKMEHFKSIGLSFTGMRFAMIIFFTVFWPIAIFWGVQDHEK